MSLFTDLFNRKSQSDNPKSRLYHYTRETEHEKSRIHLRIDTDGHGTLIVNANSVMHLNPTATFMAWLILEGKSESETVKILSKKWNAPRKQLSEDLQTFNIQFCELLRPDGACPVHELDLELAILSRRVPDETLSALRGFLCGDIQDGLQFTFVQTRSHRQTVTGINERVQPDGRNGDVRKKIQRVGNGVDVGAEHGGVGHYIEIALQSVLQPSDGLLECAIGLHHLIVDLFIA